MNENGCERGCVPSAEDWRSMAEQNGCWRYWGAMGEEGELNCWTLAVLQGD